MGLYRARDLVRVPSLLSLARLPLAAVFPLVFDHPLAGLGVIAAAGVTDVLDGWYARRFDQTSAIGAVVDPITDKVFVLTVVLTLTLAGQLPLYAVLLLHARELGELPLAVWLVRDPERRGQLHEAIPTGKLVTALQFACFMVALWEAPGLDVILWLTAIAGIAAAIAYWRRAFVTATR